MVRNSKKGISIGAFLFLFLAFLVQGKQDSGQQGSQESHEVEVRLILVDVIVTKNGEFVKDLDRSDFEVYEDGRKVPINSFELVSFDSRILKPPEEEAVRSSLPKKRLAVLFDSINTWNKEIKKGGERILEDLLSIVGLGHEVMICQLNSKTGVEILQPFTANKDLISSAVIRASGSVWDFGTIINPSHQNLTEVEKETAIYQGQQGLQTQLQEVLQQMMNERGLNRIEAAFENTYFEDMQRIEYIHRERERFQRTIGGILASLNMMKSFPGRKALLLISAGIPDLSPPDMFPNIRSGIPTEQTEGESYLSYRNKVFGKMEDIQVFDPFGILEKKKFSSGEDVLKEMINFANAHNISIYTLDSSIFVNKIFSGTSAEYYQKEEMAQFSFREGDYIRSIQNLRWISDDTGADSLKGANKFEDFQRIINTDLNHYYQLSFYPARPEADDQFHKIEVKVKRRGLDVRCRKGYTDYSEIETQRMLLVSAFYNPSLYKSLPFKAELVPFLKEGGIYEPWMNIALPVKELLEDRFISYASKTFNLHVWMTDRERGEKGYAGQVNIGLKLSPSFMEYIKNIDYLSYHFKGPEFSLSFQDFKSVFALFDPQTEEIGTLESTVFFPNLEKNNLPFMINCVLGDVVSNPEQTGQILSLSKKDGGLDFNQFKFFPKVTNQFKKWEGASVFMQIHLPEGKKAVSPHFVLRGGLDESTQLTGKLLAETWIADSGVWSGLYLFELGGISIGEKLLEVEIAASGEGAPLRKEMSLTVIR